MKNGNSTVLAHDDNDNDNEDDDNDDGDGGDQLNKKNLLVGCSVFYFLSVDDCTGHTDTHTHKNGPKNTDPTNSGFDTNTVNQYEAYSIIFNLYLISIQSRILFSCMAEYLRILFDVVSIQI